MATHAEPDAKLDPAIESVLARLRRRIRAYLWADGLAAVLAALGIAFWVSLAFDWVFEPPAPLRAALLVLFGAALVLAIYRYLVARLSVRLRNRNLALLLERRFHQFRDSLLTTVEMAEEPEHAAGFNPDMLAWVHRDARAQAGAVALGEVFNTRPLVRRLTLAAALAAAVAVFAVAAPSALGTWSRRALLLSDELWPRKTHLLVDGFDESGRVKIARGSDWTLAVNADARLGREIPEVVEVRYSTVEGARGRENMSREGVVLPGEAPFQPYAYTFRSVLAPLEFYVAGGDDREGPFYLDVVDSPTLARMSLYCEYPPYTRRSNGEIPVSGLMQVPRGTQVTIRAEANKPLVEVQIDEVVQEGTPVVHQLHLAAEHGGPQTSFEYALPRLDASTTLLFTLTDADGIGSREAVRLAIAAVADEPPQVEVALRGIGTAVTADARLPAAGEVSDDYGVARVWFDYHADETPAERQMFGGRPAGREKVSVEGVLEIGPLALEPKQRLHVSVKAEDACALAGGPNVGTSQKYVLEVVTPEELRSMLEARELMLRRRFETIMAELTDTRNLLAGLEWSAPEPEQADAVESDSPEAASERRLSNAVQVERVVQNCERSRHETLQVAEAFNEIHDEMINNRVDTAELRKRLKEGISEPLEQIVAGPFAELNARLAALSDQVGNPQQAVSTQATAIGQIDAILVEMKLVLDKMLELETFNEVVDTLRQIIDAQDEVNERTKQQQKKGLRDLIE